MESPPGDRGAGPPLPPPLVRRPTPLSGGAAAPAILGAAAATAWALSAHLGAPALRILAALLAAAGATVVVLGEVGRSRADPTRATGLAVGAVLTVLLSLQAFVGTVPAFLARAFGPSALGVPVTWAAAAAIAILLGPPLLAGGPSLMALNLAAVESGALGARVRVLLWLAGAVPVPERLRPDRNRLRLALAWMAGVIGAWIGYAAWRGI